MGSIVSSHTPPSTYQGAGHVLESPSAPPSPLPLPASMTLQLCQPRIGCRVTPPKCSLTFSELMDGGTGSRPAASQLPSPAGCFPPQDPPRALGQGPILSCSSARPALGDLGDPGTSLVSDHKPCNPRMPRGTRQPITPLCFYLQRDQLIPQGRRTPSA